VTAGGNRQVGTKTDELIRQLTELTRAVDRLTMQVGNLDTRVEKLDRWARTGSNGGGAMTAEARIQRLEDARTAKIAEEQRDVQRRTWAIAAVAIVSSMATAIAVRLIFG
jgi:hypothetical protein